MTTLNATRIEKMASMSGVGWNQTSSMIIPTGRTYQSIILKTNIKKPEQIKVARVTLNSEQIYVPTGKDLVRYQKQIGQKVIEGFYVIPFANPTMREQGGIMCTALVTEHNDAITLEIDLGDSDQEVGEPMIEVWGVVSDVVSQRIMIPRWQYQSMQAGAIGENTFDNITWSPYRYITDIEFKASQVKELKVSRDYVEVYKATKDINDFVMQQNNQNLTPPADVYWFNPVQRGMLKDYAFATMHKDQLRFTAVCDAEVNSISVLVRSFEVVRPEFFKS